MFDVTALRSDVKRMYFQLHQPRGSVARWWWRTVFVARIVFLIISLHLSTLEVSVAVAAVSPSHLGSFVNCSADTDETVFRCRTATNVSQPEIVCVSASRLCDSIEDCPEGDDEIGCEFDCDFESSAAPTSFEASAAAEEVQRSTSSCIGWTMPLASDGLVGFVRSRGWTNRDIEDPNAVHRLGPQLDHTTRTASGGYALFLNANHKGVARTTAYLVSPWLSSSINGSSSCRSVAFAVNLDGSNELSLFVRLSSRSTPLAPVDGSPKLFDSDNQIHFRNSNGTSAHQVWKAAGHKGARWRNYSVVLGQLSSNFQLVFRVIRYKDIGHVAIDSISLNSCHTHLVEPLGSCLPTQFQCSTLLCIGGDRVCDFENDCLEGDDEHPTLCETSNLPSIRRCNFEADLCGWKTGTTASARTGLAWRWSGDRNSTGAYEPGVDHTSGTGQGHYVYVDSVNGASGSMSAVIESPIFPVPPASHYNSSSDQYGACQLRFFYHIYGRHVTGLSLHVIETKDGCTASGGGDPSGSNLTTTSCNDVTGEPSYIYRNYWETRLLSNTWDGSPDVWLRAAVPLPYLTRRFVVQFEVLKGSRFHGNIAIDDVTLSAACFEEEGGDRPFTTQMSNALPGILELSTYPKNKSQRGLVFGTCGSTGQLGPTQQQCDVAYQHTDRPQVVVLHANDTGGRLPSGIQVWVVPQSGLYSIAATGASGGSGLLNVEPQSMGGYVRAVFQFRKGEQLYLLVGQQGGSACQQSQEFSSKTEALCPKPNIVRNVTGGAGGGGGASYVFKFNQTTNETELLLVAGGGGGRSVKTAEGARALYRAATGGIGHPGPGTSPVVAEFVGDMAAETSGKNSSARPGVGGGWFSRKRQSLLPMDGRGVLRGHLVDHESNLGSGGEPCRQVYQFGWFASGGFGGGGGPCHAGGGGGGYTGGLVSVVDDEAADGHGGTSFINRNGRSAVYESGAARGDGMVEIALELPCLCEYYCSFDSLTSTKFQCFCPPGRVLANDGRRCLDSAAAALTSNQREVSLIPPAGVAVLIACASVFAIALALTLACVRMKLDRRRKRQLKPLTRAHHISPALLGTLRQMQHRSPSTATAAAGAMSPAIPMVDLTNPSCPPASETPLVAAQILMIRGTDGQPLSTLLQVTDGTMITEYNPTYDFGDRLLEASCKKRDGNDSSLPEIAAVRLQIVRSIGHGAFSEVFRGQLRSAPGDMQETDIPVAVKAKEEVSFRYEELAKMGVGDAVYYCQIPTDGNTDQTERDFLMEALIMSKFCHPNIVRFIGVCFEHQPKMIVLELLDGGDLKTFLRQSRPTPVAAGCLSQVDLVHLSLDVAKGCEYLEQNRFIHRDIAARNCLLTCKGPGRKAKIADFGMARDIYSNDYYRKGGRAVLPVKWMPPEAFLDGIFTSKTDVWSFGVLMWEVFSLGYMPYPGRDNQEVMQLVANGGRLNQPNECPASIYSIMTSCWHRMPCKRPTFATIIDQLNRCLNDAEVLNGAFPVGHFSYLRGNTVDVAESRDRVVADEEIDDEENSRLWPNSREPILPQSQ